MDIAAIRQNLATMLTGQNLNVYPAVVEDAVTPFLVVGVPQSVEYGVTMGLDRVTLPLTVVAASANDKDAQTRLDAALSSKTTGTSSLYDTVRAAMAGDGQTHPWRSIQCREAGNFRLVKVGSADALAADLIVEITA